MSGLVNAFGAESGIIGTFDNVTLGSSVAFPAGVMIKTTVYNIGKGTVAGGSFPDDDTIPQRTEGSEIFSVAYTPSTANCTILIRTYAYVAESSNVANNMGLGLFISDDLNALQATSSKWGTYGSGSGHDTGVHFI